MPDFKSPSPISLRLPPPLQATLDAHLEKNRMTRSRFVRDAVIEKLMRERGPLPAVTKPSPFPK